MSDTNHTIPDFYACDWSTYWAWHAEWWLMLEGTWILA